MATDTPRPEPGDCAGCGKPLTSTASEGMCAACLLGPALALASQCEESEAELDLITAAGLEGRSLGGYEILATLARGGMGVVFQARQKNPSRVVALKVISAGELATRTMVERFHNEAQAAARLDHPNIVPIYEVGEDRGWHFFSMQLIAGRTLAEALHAQQPTPAEAARLLVQIARAVEHAHQRGILHRDLKPTNILLDEAGQPHLTDFGLAKAIEQDSELTHTQAVLGTPAYMSPEQAAGRTREITTATDVYGLGAMLYELLAGRPPFRAENTPALLRKIVEHDPAPLAVPGAGDLEVICLKCLEKDPARRYATAGDLADELERWLRHEPILARPAGNWERTLKWVRRNRARAALGATVVLAGLLLTTVSIFFNVRLQRSGQALERAVEQGRQRIIAQHLREAGRATAAGDGLVGLFSLTEALRLQPDDHPSATAIRRRLGLTLRHAPELLRLWDAEGAPYRLQFSADNRWLLAALRSGAVRVWDLRERRLLTELPATNAASLALVLSPNGRELVESLPEPPYVRLSHLEQGTSIALPLAGPCAHALAFSGSGRWVITGGERLRLWEAATGRELPVPGDTAGPWARVAASPDDRFILALAPDGSGRLLETTSWTWRSLPWLTDASGPASPVFSDDGRWLLLATDSDWLLAETASGTVVFSIPQPGIPYTATFSPDGRYFATAGFWEQGRVWTLPSPGMTNVAAFGLPIRHETGVNLMRFSPDARIIATAGFDYQLRLYGAQQHQLVAPILHHTALVEAAAFSADGRFLASADAKGLVRVWDLFPRAGVALPGLAPKPAPQFAPDGKLIAACDTQGQVRWYDAASGQPTGAPLFTPRAEPASVEPSASPRASGLAWSRDGQRLAAALGAEGVRVWEYPSGRLVAAWTNVGEATVVAFDGNGATLAAGTTTGEVLRWKLATLKAEEPWRAPFAPVERLVWNSRGPWLAAGGEAAVQVLSFSTGVEALPLLGAHDNLVALAFSPAGDRLLTAAGNHAISPGAARLWSLPALREAVPPLEHGDGLAAAVFSPDGRWVATGGEDNVLRLWQAENGAASGRVMRHEGIVRALWFDRCSEWLAAGANDGQVRLWSIPSGELAGPPLLLAGAVESVAFAPDDGQMLAVSARTNNLLVNFTPDPRPVAEMERIARAQTALRAGPGGTLEQVPLAVLAREIADHHPGGKPFPTNAAAWHARMAGPAEDAGEWFTAEFHWQRLLALQPGDAVAQQRLECVRAALARRNAPGVGR
jgi:WD40 repeat protein/predicted Ser/Thr protein kinase